MAGWCFILLFPSEFICMQTFGFLDHLRLTHCNMLIGCFPRRSSRRGLGSVESRSCSASGRMIISATFVPGVAACPGHPCSVLSCFPALPVPHINLSSVLSLALEKGWKHHMPCQKWCLDAMQPTGTHEHSLPSSLPSPLLAHHGAHLNCFAVKSLPCCWCWVGLKLASEFKPYCGRLIDRQIDNMIVRA